MKVAVRPVALLVCLAGLALPGVGSPAASLTTRTGPMAEVSVAVDAAPLGPEVPPDFLGLSFEIPPLDENEFAPGHPVLARLLQNVGPGVLRFGGNTLDRSAWGPAGTFPGAVSTITPDDLARMFAFARQIGWRVLLGLDLGHYDPAAAADEAETAIRLGGSTLEAFEFGNEPDLYTRSHAGSAPLRPDSYGVPEYLREWRSYLEAVRARVPRAPVVGPDGGGTAKGAEMLRQLLAAHGNDMEYATAHYYLLGATITDPRSPRYASIANLLSPRLLAGEGATIAEWVRDATTLAHRLRLGETNSIFGGGKNGISDVFAGALWTADYLFRVAQLGVRGVNLHGTLDRCGSYSPICAPSRALAQRDNLRVQPNYYAMLLFHHAARGRFVPARRTGREHIMAYATVSEEGAARVTLINVGTEPAIARITLPRRHRTASVMRLAAPSVEATADVTLAGSSVAPDGTWSPQSSDPLVADGATVDVMLPPTSAAAVTLSP